MAKYWPEFAASGKADIPVRRLCPTRPAWWRWTNQYRCQRRWPGIRWPTHWPRSAPLWTPGTAH
ncbi:hypothetical protein [Streptomyces sp. ISL-96]|uniref:hypothetical protein n=1 Tax=Streptomyces sp. ISL-96 TaxID=2819191 RepID=UPI0035ABABDD